MPSRTYNKFYPWIKQDNFITGWASFIEWMNVTWLKIGYGAILWPKSNKLFTTGTSKMYWLDVFSRTDGSLSQTYFWWENGEIYRGTATDDTPTHTLASGNIIVGITLFRGWYFFFTKTSLTTTGIWVSRISQANADSDTWGTMDESFVVQWTWSHISTPPTYRFWDILIIWDNGTIRTIDSAWAVGTSYSFPVSYVMGISKHWTTIKLYEDTWTMYFWDGVTNGFTSSQDTKIRVASSWQQANNDFVSNEQWDLYISSWYSSQLLSKATKSNRLNDNSTYEDKMKFWPNRNKDISIVTAEDDMYFIAEDTQVWIYQYWSIVPWVPKGFHKVVSRSNGNLPFEDITCMDYYSRENQFLLYAFKTQSGVYWVDKIDLNSLETAEDWYLISDIFAWGSILEKHIIMLKIARSYASWDDYIKLYKRVDNAASWTEITLQTLTDDIIARDNISSETDEWIDIQFKIEFHNEAQDSNPPILHELSHDYDIIKT